MFEAPTYELSAILFTGLGVILLWSKIRVFSMDRKTYNRATRICLFCGVGAAILYESDGELQWIALAIAGMAALVASSLYFYCQLRRPAETDSSHPAGQTQQPALVKKQVSQR